MMAIASEHGFPFFSARGAMLRGWALAAQGQGETGVAQLHEGLAAHRATETTLGQPYFLALAAEAWAWVGQADAGLHALDEALAATHQTGEQLYEAELHRLKGELLLQSSVRSPTSNVETRVLDTPPGASEAETCFRQALDVARRQQAKSLELRVALLLCRLWQQQGKGTAAHDLLAPIYSWFTEGFDTADLQEAKALLEDLGT
jgi:predicted ATPase